MTIKNSLNQKILKKILGHFFYCHLKPRENTTVRAESRCVVVSEISLDEAEVGFQFAASDSAFNGKSNKNSTDSK